MAGKIRTTEPSVRKIRDIGPASARIDPEVVAAALGAEEVSTTAKLEGGPITLFQVRSQLAERLRSSGGRPSLEGATRRVKIPVTEGQWREIEDLASSLADEEFSPTPGQVASILISLSLSARAGGDAQQLKQGLRSQTAVAKASAR